MIKNLIAAAFVAGIAFAAQSATVDIVVAGSKTGTYTLASNMLMKDSQQGLINKHEITLTEPGNACKGLTIASERQNTETFIIPVENLMYDVATVKKDPLCVAPDLKRAVPVFTEIQSLYLVGKKSFEVQELKTKKLKIGYVSETVLEKAWHEQLNKTLGQNHQFIGYNGSGATINGLLSGEVDVVWVTNTNIVKLEKTNPDTYKTFYASMKERDVQAPTLSAEFKDPKLSRGFITTWYLFNDKNDIANQLSISLKNMYSTSTGEWGKWAAESGKILKFDRTEQIKVINSESWIK